jgi:two-component system cell cycle sensor histidine kinase/response regulator CckA
MHMHLIIPVFSLTIQIVSIVYAIRLWRNRSKRVISIVLVVIVSLMAFRRAITLFGYVHDEMTQVDLAAETVALSISCLMLFAIIYMERLIGRERVSREELSSAEARYRTLYEQSPDGVLLIDSRGVIVEFNDQACSQLGYTRQEFGNLQLRDIDPVETTEEIKASFENVARTGRAEFKVKHRTKDGEVRDVHVITQVVHLSGQLFYHTIWRDITDQKRAEEALLHFQMAVGSAADAIGMSTPQGRHYYQNESFAKLFGRSVTDVNGSSGPPSTIFADEKAGRKIFDTIMLGGSFVGEVKMLDRDRNERDIYLRAYPIRNSEGNIISLVGVHTDITERKRSETALKEANAKLQTLIRALPDAVFFKDTDCRYILVNRAFEEMMGAGQETFIGKSDEDFMTPDLAQGCRASDETLMKSGKAVSVQDTIIGADGRTMYLDSVKAPIYDAHGVLLGIVGVSRDVTERKLAEEKLHEGEQLIRNILDTVDEGFIVVDRDYRIQIANRAYCDQLPEPLKDLTGQHCYVVSHRTGRPCFEEGEECAVRHVFADGKPHTAIHKHAGPNNTVVFVETKAFPLKDSSGNVTSAIEVITNITEKHLLEEERLKTQKLEAVGTLAGGIAHDFNNLLQGVFGYISLAKLKKDNREESMAALEEAEKALHMSVKLTNQLLTFSKGGKPVKRTIDLLPVIEDAAKFALSGSQSTFRIFAEDDLWKIDADEGQISQVIQNIVLNADQSMPDGGQIEISARNVQVPGPDLPQELARGRYVEISISDTGIGIPEKYIGRIFDPYFTTKEKGSGLGLATSYSIIRNHNGAADVRSELGKGTTFRMYLPAGAGTVQARQPAPTAASSERKGRVLVMDDEEIILKIAGQLIKALGHDVELAANGTEAIGKYTQAQASGVPFDVVILDLTIRGGMGGLETAKRLLETDPNVKAVVSSGYSNDVSISNYQAQGFKAILKKPYNVAELKAVLNSLLNT